MLHQDPDAEESRKELTGMQDEAPVLSRSTFTSPPSGRTTPQELRESSEEESQFHDLVSSSFEGSLTTYAVAKEDHGWVVYGQHRPDGAHAPEEIEKMMQRLAWSVPVEVRWVSSPDEIEITTEKVSKKAEKKKSKEPSQKELNEIINSTLPLGVYPLKITPFQCKLPGGIFRALHLKVDLPPEKIEDFEHWVDNFESTYHIRVHAQREWAGDDLEHLLKRIAGSRSLLDEQDVPALEQRLKRFQALPPFNGKEVTIPSIPLDKGVDLLSLPFVTIDAATTLDMEDALYARQNQDGSISLYVSFIDVTWFIRPNEPLDRYLSRRAYSLYGSSSAFPLLGKEFAFGAGSFVQNQPRLGWTFEFLVDQDGSLRETKLYRAALESRAKLTVEDAQAILQGDDARQDLPIKALAEVAHRLSRRRSSKEGFIIESGERAASKIVQECMIAANVEAAAMMEAKGWPAVFTIYDAPSEKQKEQLAGRIRKLGIEVAADSFDNPQEFSRLWEELRNCKAESLLSEMLDRFFPRSMFSTIPGRHSGIPALSYLRVKGNTYVGIVNQWLVEALTENEKPPFSPEELDRIGTNQNRQMRAYDSRCLRIRLTEMLRRNLGRVGESFEGTVAEVRGDSVLVQIGDGDFKKWGFVPLSEFDGRTDLPQQGEVFKLELLGFDRTKNRFRFTTKRADEVPQLKAA